MNRTKLTWVYLTMLMLFSNSDTHLVYYNVRYSKPFMVVTEVDVKIEQCTVNSVHYKELRYQK